MKNKNKETKYRPEKIIERLEDKRSFMIEIKKARTLLKIPVKNGFNSYEEHLDWILEHKKPSDVDMNLIIADLTKLSVDLLAKEKINLEASNFWQYINYYLLFGKKGQGIFIGKREKSWHMKYFGMEIQRIKTMPRDFVQYLKTINPNGVLIALNPAITKEELLRFIREEYSDIRILMRSKKPIRIRDYHNKTRDEIIYKTWGKYAPKPIRELRKITGEHNFYKTDAIASILKRDYNIEVKPDNLRTIILRMEKRRQ